ncbi:MAG TPA: pyridoxine 5'-phosphate synthase [Bacteroidetes bacterium]|nr:pyridoxine 5'-phosphate synthase [Bacteroidota bacterium]
MVRLGVNVDHVATVRQARMVQEPDPVAAAVLVELAGADGIVCHLREDRRHIQDRDLRVLRQVVKTHLNLEMAATDEMVKIATDVLPDMVTLVPEKRQELTTEGGLDVVTNMERLADVITSLHIHNIVVSLFIDPDIHQIKAASRVGADYVELHTGEYANAEDLNAQTEELEKLTSMAAAAAKLGLGVSAGHGLNYQNVRPIAQIPQVEELNIGHSIVSRAVLVGMERAVREMLDLIRNP